MGQKLIDTNDRVWAKLKKIKPIETTLSDYITTIFERWIEKWEKTHQVKLDKFFNNKGVKNDKS